MLVSGLTPDSPTRARLLISSETQSASDRTARQTVTQVSFSLLSSLQRHGFCLQKPSQSFDYLRNVSPICPTPEDHIKYAECEPRFPNMIEYNEAQTKVANSDWQAVMKSTLVGPITQTLFISFE